MLLASEDEAPRAVGGGGGDGGGGKKRPTVAILDTRTCEDEHRTSYTSYIMDFDDDVIASLRYSELLVGHEELRKHHVGLPVFPEKTVTRLLDDSFVSYRKRQLERYFAALDARIDIPRDALLHAFVPHAPRPRQASSERKAGQEQQEQGEEEGEGEEKKEEAELLCEIHTVNFSVTSSLLIDADTIVLGNADESLLSKLDVAVSTIFQRVRRNPLGGITYQHKGRKTLAVPLANPVTCMAWDGNRRWLFVAHAGTLEIYNPTPDFSYAASVMSSKLCDGTINAMHLCAEEDLLLLVSSSGDIIQFSCNSQSIAARALYAHARLLSVAFDRIGRRIFVGTSADSVVIFNCFPSSPCLYVHQMAVHDGSITALCYDHTQRLLVAGSTDKRIGVWALSEPGREREGSQFKGFMVAPAAIASLCLRGQRLCSGDDDGNVCVWSVDSGLATIAFRAHFQRVCALAALEDDLLLLTGSADESAKLWRLPRRVPSTAGSGPDDQGDEATIH